MTKWLPDGSLHTEGRRYASPHVCCCNHPQGTEEKPPPPSRSMHSVGEEVHGGRPMSSSVSWVTMRRWESDRQCHTGDRGASFSVLLKLLSAPHCLRAAMCLICMSLISCGGWTLFRFMLICNNFFQHVGNLPLGDLLAACLSSKTLHGLPGPRGSQSLVLLAGAGRILPTGLAIPDGSALMLSLPKALSPWPCKNLTCFLAF